MIYMGALSVLFVIFAPQLVGFFTQHAAVTRVAANCLRFISIGNVFYAWGMVLVQAFNGAGDTRTPSMVNFFCYWCFQIPLAWALAVPLGLEQRGVFVAIPAAEAAMTLASLWLFKRGSWKKKMI
jgi:Na+-driven multidrug efflux pump